MGEGLTDRLVRALPAGLTPQRPTGGPDSITIMLLPPYSPELNPADSSARALPVIADAATAARRIFFTLMLIARVVVLSLPSRHLWQPVTLTSRTELSSK